MECGTLIRSARMEDLASVYSIEVSSFSRPYSFAQLYVLFSLAGELFLVSEGGRGVDGYAVAVPLRGGVCHIASIAVAPWCRGRGVGSALLHSLLEVCASRGLDAYVLEVEHTNYVAQRLYASAGFRQVKVVPDYYGPGRHALVMVMDGRYEYGYV